MEGFIIKSLPVWIEGRDREMNINASFRTIVGKSRAGEATLYIACSTLYRLFVNGKFLASGPARAAHGYYRVDMIDLSSHLKNDENVVCIDVSGYNVHNFVYNDDSSFLQAEIRNGKTVLAATGYDFDCREMTERIQKIRRYTFQRAFAESYNLLPETENFYKAVNADYKKEKLMICGNKKLLKRGVLYPEYEERTPVKQIDFGNVSKIIPEVYQIGRPMIKSDVYHCYSIDELELNLSNEVQEFVYSHNVTDKKPEKEITLGENTFQTFDFGTDDTGFISFKVSAKNDTVLYVMWEEVLIENDVYPLKIDAINAIKLTIKAGEYEFINFEPITFKYVKLINVSQECTIGSLKLIQFKHPKVKKPKIKDEKLDVIYDAAIETYRQNSLDVFMDCPSRERAGWLCDSFWTSRVEFALTGDSKIETNFYENYLNCKKFKYIPDGMLPMLYPGDLPSGDYIPNWAMWFVVELEEYLARSLNHTLVEALKEKVYKLIEFLDRYLNKDGLLEKIENWVFIEWSEANNLVQDLNYPSNMLYSGMLRAAGNIYKDDNLIIRADVIAAKIRELSYNGEFFTDNAVFDENGVLKNTNKATEVCQYYAFFFNIATPQTFPDLWEKLVHKFGPLRKTNNEFPEIYFANAFIGLYLRLDILDRYGFTDMVIKNIKGYFYDMAIQTGTLWEHDSDIASVNHGFASHVIYWLNKVFI